MVHFKQRYVLTFFCNTAIVLVYVMRASLSMSLLKMVPQPRFDDPGTRIFDWTQTDQALLVSGFYIGYTVGHMPAGILAQRYGGKWLLGVGVLLSSLLTMCTPHIAAYGGYNWTFCNRVLLGVFQSSVFPACGVLMATWVPMRERSRVVSIIFSGNQIGSAIAFFATSRMLQSFEWTWSPSFLAYGIVGVVWCIFYFVFVFEEPASCPHIREPERQFLLDQLGSLARNKNLPATPWLHMAQSKPLLALAAAQFGHDWVYNTILSHISRYEHVMLDMSTADNGLYGAIPFLVMMFVSIASGFLCDWLINTNRITVTSARIYFASAGAIGPAVMLVFLSLVKDVNDSVHIVLIIMCVASMGFYYPGLKSNPLDLAQNYAAITMAFATAAGGLSGVIAPIVATSLTPHALADEWRMVFLVTVIILGASGIIFMMWGKGVSEGWNDMEHFKSRDRF